jgi:hypothetical protein
MLRPGTFASFAMSPSDSCCKILQHDRDRNTVPAESFQSRTATVLRTSLHNRARLPVKPSGKLASRIQPDERGNACARVKIFWTTVTTSVLSVFISSNATCRWPRNRTGGGGEWRATAAAGATFAGAPAFKTLVTEQTLPKWTARRNASFNPCIQVLSSAPCHAR